MAVVMPVDLAANPANAECGLTETLVAEAIQLTVQAAGLRTELLAQAQPFTTITPGAIDPDDRDAPRQLVALRYWLSLKAQSAPSDAALNPAAQDVPDLLLDRGMLLSTPRGGQPAP